MKGTPKHNTSEVKVAGVLFVTCTHAILPFGLWLNIKQLGVPPTWTLRTSSQSTGTSNKVPCWWIGGVDNLPEEMNN